MPPGPDADTGTPTDARPAAFLTLTATKESIVLPRVSLFGVSRVSLRTG